MMIWNQNETIELNLKTIKELIPKQAPGLGGF